MQRHDRHPRLRISMEVDVDVVDAAALERAAMKFVEGRNVENRSGVGAGEQRRRDIETSRDSSAEAALWATDPDDLIGAIPGVELVAARHEVVELGPDGLPAMTDPDFGQLFAVCACGNDWCERCSRWQLTPRSAAVLWAAAQLLADMAYDDVAMHGDAAVDDPEDWSVFDRYPSITRGEDAVWRRQSARAFDDLADDLAKGEWPRPRSFGEEMALHLMMQDSAGLVVDSLPPLSDAWEPLLRHRDDLDWEEAEDSLFQDIDILTLYDPSLDGIEDPDAELNTLAGMGDMRPAAWFEPFSNMTPRDGRRRFRR